ncbi:ABC transporter substrate-binding protein [Microbacterium betulae]|uniref:ABC transporter substrate-binding protein n=1 Tax=Microbacterium betulae TaxID=2981139 RepID=A0AA97FKG6_9MICO|nr:ABC transporter substrate-binding protein [Microbacterium sp. AB]WOF24715.1 ABC transporter substrate-binding protein [Microbacterium sp. AB]
MTIRDGVEWSDGEPLTADDVAFTFQMLKDTPGNDVYGAWRAEHRRDAGRRRGCGEPRRLRPPQPRPRRRRDAAARPPPVLRDPAHGPGRAGGLDDRDAGVPLDGRARRRRETAGIRASPRLLVPRELGGRRLRGRAGVHADVHRPGRPGPRAVGRRDDAHGMGVLPRGARARRAQRVGAQRRDAGARDGERHRHRGRRTADRLHEARSTTTSGRAGTGRRSGSSPSIARPSRAPKPSLAWLGEVARRGGLDA